MSDKPWPKSGPVSFSELTEPVVAAIEQAYRIRLKEEVLDGGIEWTGFDIGEPDKVCCFSPSESLNGFNLRYSYTDQGRNPLEEIVGVAVQLGIEQGRRLQAERSEKDAIHERLLARARAAAIDPEAKP